MNLRGTAPSVSMMRSIVEFVCDEVLRFRRMPGLLLLLLIWVSAIALLSAVATPKFRFRPVPRDGTGGYFGLARVPASALSWQRLAEVGEGWRRFEAGDRESFHRQRAAIDGLLDWFAQDTWWRVRKSNVKDATGEFRTYVREATAVAFHLDGLDACGDRARHAAVLEAALRYVEDLQETGAAGPAVALACDERLLRQLLRHVEVTRAPAEECEGWRARLAVHFARVGDLRRPVGKLDRTQAHLASRDETDFPWRTDRVDGEREVPRYRVTSHFEPELSAIAHAFSLPPREALDWVAARERRQQAQRLPPQPWAAILFNTVTGRVHRLPRYGLAEVARGALLRHLEWTSLRNGVLAALARSPETAPTDAFTGGPLMNPTTSGGFALYSTGANGRDDGGTGDDYPIWPPAPVRSIALGARPAVPPPAVPAICFPGPEAVARLVAARCDQLKLSVEAIRVARPAGPCDLRRARVEVIVRGERFHRLAPVLQAPTLGALGGRGEMTRLTGDLRELAFDVALEPAGSGTPDWVVLARSGGTFRATRGCAPHR